MKPIVSFVSMRGPAALRWCIQEIVGRRSSPPISTTAAKMAALQIHVADVYSNELDHLSFRA
jgi:hypothetical protein